MAERSKATKRSTAKRQFRRSRRRRFVLVPKYAVTAEKELWLTLDDGPHPIYTPRILRVLARYQLRVTFFVTGQNAERFLGIMKQAHDDGHRIGNHSYSHRQLTKLTEDEIHREIQKTDELILAYSGSDKILRSPYGAHNAVVDGVARSLGYRLVLWNVDTLDWKREYKPDRWIQHGLDQIRARNHSIVLNHDIQKTTQENFEMFIARIKGLHNLIFRSPESL